MVSRKAIAITVLAGCLVTVAVPVQSFFQAHGIFNPSNKYGEWFKETTWDGDKYPGARTNIRTNTRGGRFLLAGASTSEKYPYPVKNLEMTEKMWLKSSKAVEMGTSDWFDSEVVRHRADVEKHPPAMDLLAWMYEGGRGLKRDYRKAFMWYERAKMNGQVKLRGSSAKIFQRMPQQDQYIAELQRTEDIVALKAEGKPIPKGIEQVNLRILKSQRGSEFYNLQRARSKGQNILAPY